jgi:YHS domain-containing protein
MTDKVVDLVCGMRINPYEALAQSTYRGETYYFCSQECKDKFDKQPQKYLQQVPEPQSEH